jgi:hypothetical protein
MEKQPQDNQLQVKANDEVLKGAYSTHMQVAHTKEEFMLDFMNLFPPQAMLNSRVFMSPSHFKRMVVALQDNLKKYESNFGQVESTVNEQKEIGFKVE